MSRLVPAVDPDGLLEYSVVFNDRSLNHMSAAFQAVMRDISTALKQVYGADGVVLVPGGGTFAMEAVARQFANGSRCFVVRNGWFSYRWSQILEMGNLAVETTVAKARPVAPGRAQPFTPPPIEEVVEQIHAKRPEVVFAPHVETAAGILLPDDYVHRLAEATHAVGGLLVLDCVASGALWVDMRESGVDVLISAPQKGWSASPCAGLVMLSAAARARVAETTSSSFACDLGKWLQIMEAYEAGGHAYHGTLPTDSLATFRDAIRRTEELGFETARQRQLELGRRVRQVFTDHGYQSLAAPGFEAPGVVVCYTDDTLIHNGRKFAEQGLQTAAGVPLMCDEPEDFKTFRIGLFGLDKLEAIDRTVNNLDEALRRIAPCE